MKKIRLSENQEAVEELMKIIENLSDSLSEFSKIYSPQMDNLSRDLFFVLFLNLINLSKQVAPSNAALRLLFERCIEAVDNDEV